MNPHIKSSRQYVANILEESNYDEVKALRLVTTNYLTDPFANAGESKSFMAHFRILKLSLDNLGRDGDRDTIINAMCDIILNVLRTGYVNPEEDLREEARSFIETSRAIRNSLNSIYGKRNEDTEMFKSSLLELLNRKTTDKDIVLGVQLSDGRYLDRGSKSYFDYFPEDKTMLSESQLVSKFGDEYTIDEVRDFFKAKPELKAIFDKYRFEQCTCIPGPPGEYFTCDHCIDRGESYNV